MPGTPGTFSEDQLRDVAASSFCVVAGLYVRRPDGDLRFDGVRPAPGWHAHGYFPRRLWVLERGHRVRRRLWKRRWLDPRSGGTRHSRPPDDAASIWSCTLIVTLKLWAWLDGDGLLTGTEVIDELVDHAAFRTVQRWLGRALARVDELLHYLRLAVIERCEPRPVEQLFPSGHDPPARLLRRRWRRPGEITRLWQALSWLFGGAIMLATPAAVLLAEARGRRGATESTFPL